MTAWATANPWATLLLAVVALVVAAQCYLMLSDDGPGPGDGPEAGV